MSESTPISLVIPAASAAGAREHRSWLFGPGQPTSWTTPFTKCWTVGHSFAKWFVGGGSTSPTTVVDRHVRPAMEIGSPSTGKASRWRISAHADLFRSPLAEGIKAANALHDLGLVTGDRDAIYCR